MAGLYGQEKLPGSQQAILTSCESQAPMIPSGRYYASVYGYTQTSVMTCLAQRSRTRAWRFTRAARQARLSIDIGRVQDNSFAIMQSALRILWYESNLAYLAGQLAYILDGQILCAVALP